jgi:HlyD family secretion protein
MKSAQPLTATGKTVPASAARRNRRVRRWIPWAIGIVLIAAIVAGMIPKPMPVETALVNRGLLRVSVNEEGKTRIKNRFVVSAPVAGQLRRIAFKAGAQVNANETVLALIDPITSSMLDLRSRALAEARRETAATYLEKARLGHKFSASELKRFEQLFADKTISVQELETVQWREASAAKELAVAESSLRQAEAELAEFTVPNTSETSRPPLEIKAPVSGRILKIIEESSRTVIAGTPLLEIGNPADIEAVIEVLSRDGAMIVPGTKVELEHWGGEKPLQATVRLVEPSAFTKVSALGVEEQRVNVIADIQTPMQERQTLGDNFRVEARIILWEDPQALKVSSGALFRTGNEWSAFVVKDGKAQKVITKSGKTSGTEVQILDGLKEGDQVIIYPGDRIKKGQRVHPITLE